jgi:hypothetical protein
MIGFAGAMATVLTGFIGSTFNGTTFSRRVLAVLRNGSTVFTIFSGVAAAFGVGFNGVTNSGAASGAVTVRTGADIGAGGGAGNGTAARAIGFGGVMGAGVEAFGSVRLGGDCVGISWASSTATIAIDNPMEMISLRRRIAQTP